MAVRISDKQAKEGMMKTFHLVKKVAAVSTLAVFAFTVIPQPSGAARPSTQISKQQRAEGISRAMNQMDELNAMKRELEAFRQAENPLEGAGGYYVDPAGIEGAWLKAVPPDKRTPELCMKAVRENGLMLSEVPASIMSEEICLEAVKDAPQALALAPDGFRTHAVCLAAVGRQGNLLRFVPERLRTAEICMAAVASDGDALSDVPDRLKTPELCLVAVRSSRVGIALSKVPMHLRTKDICLEALRKNPATFDDVPDEARDSEIYAWALAGAQARGRKGLQEWIQTQIPNSIKTEVLLKAAKINIADVEPK